MSQINARKASLASIQPLRAMFLREISAQVRYNACHERGMSDSYLLTFDGADVGYGSVKGKEDLSARDAVFELYVLPSLRAHSAALLCALIAASMASWIECQSN